MAISKLTTGQTQLITASRGEPMVRLEGVSVSFRDGTHALDTLTLEVVRGTCLGVLGPNGAGKTSLLRLLAGLLPPTQGHVELFGALPRRAPIALRSRISYVAQRSGIDEYLSGRGNLLLAGRLHGLHGSFLQQRVQALLELVGLAEHASRRACYYSGGMRRRLALACSLIHQPNLLLLDEPTTGLDTVGKATLWSYLRSLQKAGLTIIVASHDTQEIDRYCDQVVMLHRGRLVQAGTPATLKAQLRGDIISLDLSEPHQEAPAQHLLQQQPFIQAICSGPNEGQLSLETADGPEAIPQITRLLEDHGLPPRRMTLSHPTLEDVFFRATGAQLADPSAAQEAQQSGSNRKKESPFQRYRRHRNEL